MQQNEQHQQVFLCKTENWKNLHCGAIWKKYDILNLGNLVLMWTSIFLSNQCRTCDSNAVCAIDLFTTSVDNDVQMHVSNFYCVKLSDL